MAAAYRSIVIKFEANTASIKDALKTVEREATDVNAALREVNKGLKLDPTNAELMAKKFDKLQDSIKNTKDRLEVLQRFQAMATEQLAKGGLTDEERRNQEAQLESLGKEIDRCNQKLQNYQKEIKATAQALTDRLKTAAAELKNELLGLTDVIKKSEAAFVAFMAASSNVGMNFEAAMSNVAATLNISQSSEEYEKLSAAAKKMGETTSFNASEAAFALNALAQAGYNADESIERLPKTLTIAKAGNLDLASAAKIVTNSMAALGLEEEQLDTFLDEMARTAQKSNTNIAELGEAVKSVGGTMSMANQSIETMFTELGVLANAGVTASEAATHLRNIMLQVVKTDVQESLKEMGVEVVDRTGEIRDLCDIMTDLNKATSGMKSGELVETFGELFNVRDLASIKALLNGTTGTMQELRTEIENSQGAAQAMSDTMGDNLKGDLTILQSAVEGFQIALADKLNPSMRTTAQNASKLVGEISDSVRGGELSKTIEKFSESLNSLINGGMTTAAQVLPVIIKFLTEIMDKMELIIGIYTAMAVQAKSKAVITAIAGTVNAVIGLTEAIQAASGAQAVFNALTSANAIGLIATAIGLAAGGIVAYKLAVSGASEETIKLSDETQKLVDTSRELAESAAELNAEYDKSLNTVEEQTKNFSHLADSIIDLTEKTELSGGEHELLLGYINELNGAIPDLNLAIDEETGKLNMQGEELKKLIKLQQTYAEISERQKYGAQLQIQFTPVEENFNELTKQYKEAEKKLEELYNNRGDRVKELYSKTGFWDTAEEMADAEIAEQTAEFEALRDAVIDAGNAYYELKDNIEENKNALDKLTGSLEDFEDANGGAGDSSDKTSDSLDDETTSAEKLKTAYDNAKTAVSSYKSELTNLLSILDQVNDSTAYSTSQILDLIEKYPELTGAIKATADGYTIEATALENLIKIKAQNLIASAEEERLAIGRQISELMPHGPDDNFDSDLYHQLSRQYEAVTQQLIGYRKIAEDIANGNYYSGSSGSSSSSGGTSNYSSSVYEKEDTTDYHKKAAEEEIAAAEHAYKMEEISAEEYYRRLEEINKRYFENRVEYLDEYRKYEEKVYAGLKKAQEDELSKAADYEKKLRDIKKAQDELLQAESRQVQVYSGAAGFHAEQNTAAIEKANETLEEKNLSLAEFVVKHSKWNGESIREMLEKVNFAEFASVLPDLSAIKIPAAQSVSNSVSNDNSTQNRTVNITYEPTINIHGAVDNSTIKRIRDEQKNDFEKLLNEYLDISAAELRTGGI